MNFLPIVFSNFYKLKEEVNKKGHKIYLFSPGYVNEFFTVWNRRYSFESFDTEEEANTRFEELIK